MSRHYCRRGLLQSVSYRVLIISARLRLKCDDTRAENRYRLSAKRTSPFKSAGTSVQSTTGSRDVRISGSNAGYTIFRGSVKSTGYPLHSSVSHSLSLPASPCAITFQLDSNALILVLPNGTLIWYSAGCSWVPHN